VHKPIGLPIYGSGPTYMHYAGLGSRTSRSRWSEGRRCTIKPKRLKLKSKVVIARSRGYR